MTNDLRTLAAAAAISGFVSVAAGAFGAHALKAALSPAATGVWQTAVQYQMFHTLALLAVGAFPWAATGRRLARAAGWLFVGGIALFSGSLYLLALTGLRWWGAVTPVGGTLLLAGWACLGLALLRRRYAGDSA